MWRAEWEGLCARLAGRFARVEPREQAQAFVRAMLAPVSTRSCWQLAEAAGDDTPDRMQRLLGRAVWDHDGVRDDLRVWVAAQLGGGGIGIIDETADAKKGTRTVGVARQYSGTLGRVDSCQVAVFLAYAQPGTGHALVDREIYLPRCWAADPERRRDAGVPEQVRFATKPQLAAAMVERALAAGLDLSWLTADEVYGNDPVLRARARAHGLGYVMAVSRDTRMTRPDHPHLTVTAQQVATFLPEHVWGRYSAGAGSKGPRTYDWAYVKIAESEADGSVAGHHWLLIRRSINTGELAFYRCWSPRPVALAALVRVAGARWAIEESFQQAKGQVGLDEHQVRTWRSWYRFTTLAMVAFAFLAVLSARHRPPRTTTPRPDDPIGLSVPEARRLLHWIIKPVQQSIDHALAWTAWRLRHQARARFYHYRRRLSIDPAR